MTVLDEDGFEEHDTPRTAEEIARRALVLHCVIAAGHDVSKKDITEWLVEENLLDACSPWETEFLNSHNSSKRDVIKATWRVEAQVALLWAIQKTSRLDALTGECDTKPLVTSIPELFTSTDSFIQTAVLRPADEIDVEYEKVYDAHVQARVAIRNHLPIPDQLNPDVLQERHYAFNWIIGYCGQAWDDVLTDT